MKPFVESESWKKVKKLLASSLDKRHCALDGKKLHLPTAYQQRLEEVERTLSDASYVMTRLPLRPEGCITVIPNRLWDEYLRYRKNAGLTASELRDHYMLPKKEISGHQRWSIPFELGEWAGLARHVEKPQADKPKDAGAEAAGANLARHVSRRRREWSRACTLKAGTVWIEIWDNERWKRHYKQYQEQAAAKLASR